MPAPQTPPQIFDRQKLAAKRDRAAETFEDYAFLKARVSRDLIERLEDTSHRFERGLEIGAATGALAAQLNGTDKVAHMTAGDISSAMVAKARARGLDARILDEEALAMAPGSVDLVLSSLSLHWVNDLPGALTQIRLALKPDGLFLGALFGAGTLMALRACLVEAESELAGGIAPRVSPLPGLADMAALMQRAGFALPVVDKDLVTVRYDTMFALLADLKGMGERASFARGMGQPLPRRVLMRAAELYARDHSDPDGRIRAHFEIVYLSGWAPAPHQPKPLKPGSATVSLANAVRKSAKD